MDIHWILRNPFVSKKNKSLVIKYAVIVYIGIVLVLYSFE